MALAKTVAASKFLILVGDGASPEVFAAPCGITTRGFNRTAETADDAIPDCDDEDAPAWLERVVQSLSGEISGSGKLDLDALDVWDEWFQSGQPRNCQVKIDYPGAQNGRRWEGAFILQNFNIASEQRLTATVEVTMSSSGQITKVDAA